MPETGKELLDFLKTLPAIPGRVIPIRQLEFFLAAPSNLLALLPSSGRQLWMAGNGAAARQSGVGADQSPDRCHGSARMTNEDLINSFKRSPFFPEDISNLGEQISLLCFRPLQEKIQVFFFPLDKVPFFVAPATCLCHHPTAPGINGILTNVTEAQNWNCVKNTSFP